MEEATIGNEYRQDSRSPVLGADATIRSGTIIYDDVVSGDGLKTGHNAVIRERTILGDNVLVGTNAVIDGDTDIGSNVSLQTGVYVPTNTTIGDNVFVGPHAVLTNDPAPLRTEGDLRGPTLEEHSSVGANATILPGVTVGRGSFVGAGAVVTRDVPPERLAIGAPATHEPLPKQLHGGNRIE
ncbi:N-acetyltransferase [Salinadaptatus halalkaliphilus]|uniref:N-acetyltransferase n=1 Tax=Salinadaptatus halalkaliphilus TaxID=2419781 RepID=A0A4S3TJZ5_9EURY|nr:acyltransferase [Salinadaptatus halalkaliphilus]THE64429.1 N-acetyltransferase [Salinadaptatus halalkaliphilus]